MNVNTGGRWRWLVMDDSESYDYNRRDVCSHGLKCGQRQQMIVQYVINKMTMTIKKRNYSERKAASWPVDIPFWLMAVTCVLRTAYHQGRASWLIPIPLNLQLEQLFTPFIPCPDLLMPVQGQQGSWTGACLNINSAEGGQVLHTASKPFSHARCACPVIKALK